MEKKGGRMERTEFNEEEAEEEEEDYIQFGVI